MEEEIKEEQTTTTPATEQTTSAYTDPLKEKLSGQAGSLNYMEGAEQTGKEGAEKIKGVEVPRYKPITLKRMINDPAIRQEAPSLVRNAIFKGLEGALSSKASGREFDPTTRIGQYNDAEMQRYTENATDKENSTYQAQKQPIENAISAQTQAGIQTEDAALNSYIQDYTAEKDQNRKMAILHQVMGQAGLTKGVDEEGNPIYKDWTELETSDLLKLNQLMQYLSGDTSVMNVLVGQYGPDVMQKVDDIIAWLKGDKTSDKTPITNTPAPKYTSLADWKTAYDNDDPSAISYAEERIVDLGNGNYYDVSDTSDEALMSLANTLANIVVNGTNGRKDYANTQGVYDNVLKQIENKTKAITGNSQSGKDAKAKVMSFTNKKVADLRNAGNSIKVIDDQLAQLLKDTKGVSTKVDTNALKQDIENSPMSEEEKAERLKQVEGAENDIAYNKEREEVKTQEEKQAKDIKDRANAVNKVVPVTKTNYAKAGTYQQALNECAELVNKLKATKEPLTVLKTTKGYQRIKDIALLATNGGRFEKEDTTGNLANYLSYLGDPSYWE